MCLSACYLAGIKEVYYIGTLDEAKEAGLGVSHIYEELRKDLSRQKMPLQQLSSTLDSDPIKFWVDTK
jgi:tRNA(Arg) A34 adenosine deaminase TadA